MNRILPFLLVLAMVAPALSSPGPESPFPAARGSARGAALTAGSPADLALGARASLADLRSGKPGAETAAREALDRLLANAGPPGTWESAAAARAMAEGALAFGATDAGYAASLRAGAEQALAPVREWLADYPAMQAVHENEEPAWVRGRPEVASQAILAWVALERGGSDPARRQAIARMAEGLKKLLRKSFSRYPFGAHFSYLTNEGRPRTYVSPASEEPVAGASWIVERNYTAAALARAGELLEDASLVESAEMEGLGVLAYLAVSERIPYGFAPRPEVGPGSRVSVAAVVENLAALQQVARKPVFGRLAGLAASLAEGRPPGGGRNEAATTLIAEAVAGLPEASWASARDVRSPFSFQVIEAEDGRAVQKAFEAFPIEYPGGTPGKLAVVGRENMFWMRFDVDREDEYFFYLSFLKSNVSGGLVSVMMRIDGDKIFQVPLGGATGDPFVDVDLVAGPRHLRQGPHSFGIRFSGLLMKKPAVLDSVIVQPAVTRRWVRLPDGQGALVLKSLAEDPLKVRVQELEGEAAPTWLMISGSGNPVQPKVSTDRRGRAWLEMPAGGVATLTWPGAIPGLEENGEASR